MGKWESEKVESGSARAWGSEHWLQIFRCCLSYWRINTTELLSATPLKGNYGLRSWGKDWGGQFSSWAGRLPPAGSAQLQPEIKQGGRARFFASRWVHLSFTCIITNISSDSCSLCNECPVFRSSISKPMFVPGLSPIKKKKQCLSGKPVRRMLLQWSLLFHHSLLPSAVFCSSPICTPSPPWINPWEVPGTEVLWVNVSLGGGQGGERICWISEFSFRSCRRQKWHKAPQKGEAKQLKSKRAAHREEWWEERQ